MNTTLNENSDPTKLYAEKTPVEFKKAPVDRSRYAVFLMHLTEDMVHHTAKVLIERMLDGLLADGLNPAGIMRNGDTIEVSFKDPTKETLKKMGSRAFAQNGVLVYYLRDNEPMLIVNIRGNDFRHPIVDACELVKMYGKIVHCYRQLHEYRGHRFENGIISVWMKDIHTVVPTKFDKRRSCFYNKEKSKLILLQVATRAKAVEIVRTNPPVKAMETPSAGTGGVVADLAALVEPSVPRQVMVAEDDGVASLVDPTVTRQPGDEMVVAVAGISDGAGSVEPASSRQPMVRREAEEADPDDAAFEIINPPKAEVLEWGWANMTVVYKEMVAQRGEGAALPLVEEVAMEYKRRELIKEGRHHQCGLCSKKFHTIEHLRLHALKRHAEAETEVVEEMVDEVALVKQLTPSQPDVQHDAAQAGAEHKTPVSEAKLDTLKTKGLSDLMKKEMQKKYQDKHSVLGKKKSGQKKK